MRELERYQLDLVGQTLCLVPEYPRPKIDDRFRDHVIRSEAACFGHSGEERGGTVNRPSSGGELDQGMDEESGQKRLEEDPVLGIFNSRLRQSFSGMRVEVWGIEPECAVFITSVLKLCW